MGLYVGIGCCGLCWCLGFCFGLIVALFYMLRCGWQLLLLFSVVLVDFVVVVICFSWWVSAHTC